MSHRTSAVACLQPASPPHAVTITPNRLQTLESFADRSSTARQSHGFEFESAIISLLGLIPGLKYTSKFDAFDTDPSIPGPPVPFSIKNIKDRSAVMLGDLKRAASVDRDFLFYVSFWQRDGERHTVKRVHVMSVDAAAWRNLWPSPIAPFLSDSTFQGITNDYADDDRWAARRTALQEEWRASLPPGSPMAWNPKRDHKQQKRVQCSIPHSGFDALFRRFYDPVRTEELETLLDI